MRLLDLFCGRWGWSRAFAARGWDCVGVDLTRPQEVPQYCQFVKLDVLDILWLQQPYPHFNTSILDEPNPFWEGPFDFIVASSPCEEFASHGMKHFRQNPKYPEIGIKLFNHTRELCEGSGLPYVIENVRSAEQFVGPAVNHAGSFYLWGNAVPPLLPKIHKARWFRREGKPGNFAKELLLAKPERKALLATIPPELANCVADYAERILEQRRYATRLMPAEVTS